MKNTHLSLGTTRARVGARNPKVTPTVIADLICNLAVVMRFRVKHGMTVKRVREAMAGLATLALVVTMMSFVTLGAPLKRAEAAELQIKRGECKGSYERFSPSIGYEYTNAPQTKTVAFAGKTWDLIGYNDGSKKIGVAGPNGSATLILDEVSYDDKTMKSAFDSSGYRNYNGSTLQGKMQSIYSNFTVDQKEAIVPRTLEASKDEITGSTAVDQHLWPLSITEAIQLKATVRFYDVPGDWWLRTPENYSGINPGVSLGSHGLIYTSGYTPDSVESVRPAFYISLSTLQSVSNVNQVYQEIESLSSVSAKYYQIGACPKIPTVGINGHTYDIIGANDVLAGGVGQFGVKSHIGNTATLLLSRVSNGFPYKKCNEQTTHDYGRFHSSSNHYEGSDLKCGLDHFFTLSGLNDDQIVEPTFEGGEVYTDGSPGDGVAGETVRDNRFWPLSFNEAMTLDYQNMFFGHDGWWLRTPGKDTDTAFFCNFYGTCPDVSDNVRSHNVRVQYAYRPAFYLNLANSPEIATQIKQAVVEAGGSEIYNFNPDITVNPLPCRHPFVGTQPNCYEKCPSPQIGEHQPDCHPPTPITCTNGSTNPPKCDNVVLPPLSGGLGSANDNLQTANTATKSVKVSKPKATKIKLKSGINQITASWSVLKGKWKVTKLTLQYRLKGKVKWTTVKPALKKSAKKATVKKLGNNKTYQFRLKVDYQLTNKSKFSIWSKIVSAKSKAKRLLPKLVPVNSDPAANSVTQKYLYAYCKDGTASRSRLGAKDYRGMCSWHKGIKVKLGSKKPNVEKFI